MPHLPLLIQRHTKFRDTRGPFRIHRRAHEALPWLSNTRLSLSTRGSPPEATRGFYHPRAHEAPGAHEAPHSPELTRLSLLESTRLSPGNTRPETLKGNTGPFFPEDHESPELTGLPTTLAARAHGARRGVSSTGLGWSNTGLRWSSRDSMVATRGRGTTRKQRKTIYMAP